MSYYRSRGKMLWDTLQESLRAVRGASSGGAGSTPVIWGVDSCGTFVGGMTFDGFREQATKILLEGGRVFRWQDTVCLEVGDEEGRRLEVLATRSAAEPNARSLLSNLLVVGVKGDASSKQSVLDVKLVNALLADEGLWRKLPQVKTYARRPVYDGQFSLCGPGWNADRGVLVHGPDVQPGIDPPAYAADAPPLERIPPVTRRLLRDFCWRDGADLVNAVGVLLTGLLGNHFIDDPKPVVLVDGNQPGVGKTLFCQALGRVLDGFEPRRIPLAREEELEKRLCAAVKEAQSGLLFFDNVRDRMASATLESNALSPVLSFRVLGQSGTVTRPNTFLWVVTSNQASGTEDLVSRALPIRLRYEGNPRERSFGEDLLGLATKRRLEILGELAGMVERWKLAGMPRGGAKHRCSRWAEVVGGILEANGLGEWFLANVGEAEEAMDEGLQALAALAEHAVGRRLKEFYGTADAMGGNGKAAADWVALFDGAEACQAQLAGKTPKGKATWVGTFLGAKVGRCVSFATPTASGTATLRVREGRARKKGYLFEVVFETEPGDRPPQRTPDLIGRNESAFTREPPKPVTPPPPQPEPAAVAAVEWL